MSEHAPSVGRMKPVEFFFWIYVDPESGALRRTPCRMDREEAARRFPGAVPDPLTREVRQLPESPCEWDSAGAGRR